MINNTYYTVLCPPLPDPVNGLVKEFGNRINDTAEFSCEDGYHLDGADVLTCTGDGSWDPAPPVCQGKQTLFPFNCLNLLYDCCTVVCPILVSPMNGQVVLSGILPGDTAMYTCNAIYTLEGEELRNCQDDGTWDHSKPACNPGYSEQMLHIYTITDKHSAADVYS